jgi:RNA polymerase-binding transcription factor DksA
MERSADISDQATDTEMEFNNDNVARVRKLVPDPTHRAEACGVCGGEVEPPARRELGHTTCITCAEIEEKRRGR